MNKYLKLMLLLSILISGCVRHNQINFSSSENFFTSLNEKTKLNEKTELHEKTELNEKTETQKRKKIYKKDNEKIKKSLKLTFSSYEKQLKQKFGFNEITILKKFNNPNLQVKHGKIKNFQYHLNSCYLDLFFLNEYGTYIFKHFDIRPSSITSNLNKEECVKQLNKKFILIPGLK